MYSSKVDDGTVEVNTTIVVTPVSDCAAGLKSGRRESASETTLSYPCLYWTIKLYSAKYENHLAICRERCRLFTSVRKDACSV